MSEARLELVETKQVRQFAFDIVMDVLGMDDQDADDQAYASEQVDGWMEHWGKSRRVLSVPTDQMVEAGNQAWHEGWAAWWKNGEPDWSDPDEAGRRIVTAALTAAFNTLGIQEKADTA
jgi:hypothetical protein